MIKQGDCLELMKELPSGSVDLILTDLPYGTTDCAFDVRIPFEPMWEQFLRVTKENAAIVLFSQMPFGSDLIQSQRKLFRYEWIWHKTNPVGFLNANKMPLRAHENILVFYRKLPTYNPQYSQGKPYFRKRGRLDTGRCYQVTRLKDVKNDGLRYPLDVMKYGLDAERSSVNVMTAHGTQKPVALCEYLIKTYTNEGELVLDACMGSGSTAVAAVNTNRHFIGYETHQPFVDICNRRIAEAREKLLQAQTSVLEGLDDGDNNQWGDNERDDIAV